MSASASLTRSVVVLLVLLVSPAFSQYSTARPVPEKYVKGFESITAADAKAKLSVLVSDEFAGRGTGQPGFNKAAKWYAQQLKKVGFQPAGDDGTYFQNVPLVQSRVEKDTGLTLDGKPVEGAFGLSTYIGEAEIKGTLVFANLVDIQADIGEAKDFDGKVVVYSARSRRRFFGGAVPKALREAKPAALIRVTAGALASDRINRNSRRPVGSSKIPSISINRTMADQLAKASGLADEYFSKTPDANKVDATEKEITGRISTVRETIDVPNVIGWYPGTDPQLRHEHVGLGAHLDHLGRRGDQVFPGADDNGSGSTALLEIAKAIHTNPVKPKRSIFLIVFCGEELGLLGSRYYVEHPTKPLKDMVCMLNIDMIGRNEEKPNEPASENVESIHLVGSKRISMELHELTLTANQHIGFVFEYDEEGVYTRSDHANFARKGIPITFIFGGFHPHYHRTTDTLKGINFSKIVNGARLNYLCAMMASDHGHFAKNKKKDAVQKGAQGAR